MHIFLILIFLKFVDTVQHVLSNHLIRESQKVVAQDKGLLNTGKFTLLLLL